jgi:orotate phosphoribosyltransferase
MLTDRTAQDFIGFAVRAGVLRFGEFKTKAGRLSPYFFNAGLFDDGAKLLALSDAYAMRLLPHAASFDLIFGPAYKGITLAAALAMQMARAGHNKPYAYNRKEVKDHGEGGVLVGAPLQGQRVLIVDDVISAGTSVRESIQMIRAAGGVPVAVAIALDRQERGSSGGVDLPESAVQQVQREHGLTVHAIATLTDLLDFVRDEPAARDYAAAVQAYRDRYGVTA